MPERVVVTFYTRAECGLCDKAKAVVDQVVARESLPVDVSVIDIDASPELRAQYGNDIPVIEIAGVEAFRHRVDAKAFSERVRQLLDGSTETSERPGLAAKECVPCRGGVPPLPADDVERLKREISAEWRVENGHHLNREYRFSDFRSALEFTNRVGEVSESAGHHPDIALGWGYVRITIWTHAIDGLTESDFILAARIDALSR